MDVGTLLSMLLGHVMKSRAEQKFPVMQGYPYAVAARPRTEEGEYWPKTESESPYLASGKNTFATPAGASPEYMAGEYMHLLSQEDPYYKMMAKRFDNNRRPEAIATEDRLRQKRGDHRPFPQYWNREGREAHLRAGVFPNEFGVGQDPSWAEAQSAYTPKQNETVDLLKQYMTQPLYDNQGRSM